MFNFNRRSSRRNPGKVAGSAKRRQPALPAAVEPLETRRLLTAFTVTDNSDNASDPGSIRYAFANLAVGNAANTNTINFHTPLTGGNIIPLTNGPLSTNYGVYLDNASGSGVTISGGNASTVLNVGGTAAVIITNLKITGGNTSTFPDAGGINVNSSPSASPAADLTLINSTISGNTGSTSGGIFNNYGTVNVLSSTISGNSGQYSGAIESVGGSVVVTNSTVANNSATDAGGETGAGGISLFAETTASATLTLTNATLSGNTAANPNSAYDVWAGHGDGVMTATASLVNTILASASLTSPTLANVVTATGGTVTSDGNNISSDSSFTATTGDQLDTDPTLAPLANNGGPTQTQALKFGSPAINAGNNTPITSSFIMFDQRGPGFPRIVGGTVDIGAYESAKVATTIHASDHGGVYNGTPFPATGYVAGFSANIGTPVFTYYLAADKTFSHPLGGAPTDAGSYVFLASYPGNNIYLSTATSGTFTISKAPATIHASDLGGPFNNKPYPATGYVAGVGGVHIGTPVFMYYLSSDTTHSHPLAGAPSKIGNYVFVATFAGNIDYVSTSTSAPFSIKATMPI